MKRWAASIALVFLGACMALGGYGAYQDHQKVQQLWIWAQQAEQRLQKIPVSPELKK
jgi:hypothetical protein